VRHRLRLDGLGHLLAGVWGAYCNASGTNAFARGVGASSPRAGQDTYSGNSIDFTDKISIALTANLNATQGTLADVGGNAFNLSGGTLYSFRVRYMGAKTDGSKAAVEVHELHAYCNTSSQASLVTDSIIFQSPTSGSKGFAAQGWTITAAAVSNSPELRFTVNPASLAQGRIRCLRGLLSYLLAFDVIVPRIGNL
jgi:hypothetical protein